MKYGFPSWMCSKPNDACCELYNHILSKEDKKGARLLYPKVPVAIRTIVEDRIEFLEAVVDADLPASSKKHYQQRLSRAQQKLTEVQQLFH